MISDRMEITETEFAILVLTGRVRDYAHGPVATIFGPDSTWEPKRTVLRSTIEYPNNAGWHFGTLHMWDGHNWQALTVVKE